MPRKRQETRVQTKIITFAHRRGEERRVGEVAVNKRALFDVLDAVKPIEHPAREVSPGVRLR